MSPSVHWEIRHPIDDVVGDPDAQLEHRDAVQDYVSDGGATPQERENASRKARKKLDG